MTSPKNLPDSENASNLLAALLSIIARPLAAEVARLLSEQAPAKFSEFYTKAERPPGTPSWRAALETARREGIRCVRIGRGVAIDRVAWDAHYARAAAPEAASISDVERLRAMGVVLPMTRRAS